MSGSGMDLDCLAPSHTIAVEEEDSLSWYIRGRPGRLKPGHPTLIHFNGSLLWQHDRLPSISWTTYWGFSVAANRSQSRVEAAVLRWNKAARRDDRFLRTTLFHRWRGGFPPDLTRLIIQEYLFGVPFTLPCLKPSWVIVKQYLPLVCYPPPLPYPPLPYLHQIGWPSLTPWTRKNSWAWVRLNAVAEFGRGAAARRHRKMLASDTPAKRIFYQVFYMVAWDGDDLRRFYDHLCKCTPHKCGYRFTCLAVR